MKIRIASLLLALALPLAAQEPVAAETEAMFYKAFYLERGQRDFAGAMALYEQFLTKAPEHKLAAEAAKQQFNLLKATGKAKESEAFKAKYEKLLGNIANAPAPGAGAGGDRPAGGGNRPGAGAGAGAGGGRPDMAARVAELEKQLEKAKADGNAEEVKRLETQIERAKQGGRGQGGPGGAAGGAPGGRRGGLMGALSSNKKVADMTAEEITQLKESLGNSARTIDMMKQNGQEEQAKKVEANIEALKKALEANKTEDAQKALDALKESMPRGRGRGGEAGGAGGAGAGNRGGGAGNNGGGGGGNNGGGGGGGR